MSQSQPHLQAKRVGKEAMAYYRTNTTCFCATAEQRTPESMHEEQAKLSQLKLAKMKSLGNVDARSSMHGLREGVNLQLLTLTSFIPHDACG